MSGTYHFLDPKHTDPGRLKKERTRARELRQSAWWKNQIQRGICHYCQESFSPGDLEMDHIVPVARGGRSTKGNLVPSCRSCNQKKGLDTPVDQFFCSLEQ